VKKSAANHKRRLPWSKINLLLIFIGGAKFTGSVGIEPALPFFVLNFVVYRKKLPLGLVNPNSLHIKTR